MTNTSSTPLSGPTRSIERLVIGRATSDGAGVKLTRVLTQNLQRRLDPFLMLDAFCSDQPDDYIGGFPDHPHRGFETVTYMLAGRMRHHDSAGNSGLLGPGAAQWMTAGSGLIHSELPEQEEGLMEGFQLWINLPARNKMVAPYYRDIPSEAIPETDAGNGIHARVIAGEFNGVKGAIQRPDTEPLYLDLHMPAGSVLNLPIPIQHNAFFYVYRGTVKVADQTVPSRNMAVLANDAGMLEIHAEEDARLILVAGQPLNEPIAQYGPFVMNTAEEIEQTLRDYRDNQFGAIVVQER